MSLMDRISTSYHARWRAAAADLGVEPEQLDTMTYIDYCRHRWNEWCAANGRNRHQLTEADHRAFDAWLTERSSS